MSTEKNISLKDAAKISGYAPDYVGQLIRQGKLPGKQVYSAMAWMTTEKDVREYMALFHGQEKNTPRPFPARIFERVRRFRLRLAEPVVLYRGALFIIFCFSAIFLVILFYLLSVGIEKKLTARAVERAQMIK